MATFRDKLWIWGQHPGSHHEPDNPYGLPPGSNRMTAFEGAHYLGVPNCCRVVSIGMPEPPFDQDSIVLDMLDRVVWSILGCSGSTRNYGGASDLDEVIRIARMHPNVVGGILDDFMNQRRTKEYTPSALGAFRTRMNEEVGRKMQLWTVIYTEELVENVQGHLDECDVASMWTWDGKCITDLDSNLAKLRAMFKDKPILMGCYMWDYGGAKAISNDLMEYQLQKYYDWLMSGRIEGVIICSNCIADLGLETVEMTRQWIRQHGDEQVPD